MKIFNSVLFIVFLSVGLSCKTAQLKYIQNSDYPDDFAFTDSMQMADTILPYALFFDDKLLNNLIQVALENNFDLLSNEKSIAIAEQYFLQSKSNFYPNVGLNVMGFNNQYRSENFYSNPSANYYKESGTTAPDIMYAYQSQYSQALTATWEIDIWGKHRKQKESSWAKYYGARELLKASRTQIVATVAEYYYNLIMLDAQLRIANKNALLRDSTFTMVKLQYDAGEVTSLAVQQLETQVLNAKALIPQIERDISRIENNIQLLCGVYPEEKVARLDLESMNIAFDDVDSFPLYFIQNRPDIVNAQYQLQSANAQVGVAQAMQYPNLSISVGGGINAMMPANWFNIPGALFGSLLGGISQPLLNNRKLKTNRLVSELDRDKIEIAFQKTVHSAVTETYNSLVNLEKMREQHLIALQQVAISNNALSDAKMLFKAGFATYLEVITVQEQAMSLELNLARVRSNLMIAKLQLYRSLGGGWY